tara:strand:- start:159 stop:365 length:207 start_codon:yes stop_codon:yes gene_type:complete
MDRKYLAKQKIAVIDNNGCVLKTIMRVPYSHAGYDSYKYNGALYPAYWNSAICNPIGCAGFIKVTSND